MTVEKPENMFLKQKIFIILWLDDSFYRYENCWIFSIGKEPARVFFVIFSERCWHVLSICNFFFRLE